MAVQLASGCSGEAPVSEVRPVDGFYQVTTTTQNDTCSPATAQGSSVDIVEGTSVVLNVNLWSGLRQDIPLVKGEPLEKWQCAPEDTRRDTPIFRAVYTLSELTSHSFKAASTFDWNDPTACPSSEPVVLPSAPCSVERTQTFELIAACPAKFGNLGCPDPRQ